MLVSRLYLNLRIKDEARSREYSRYAPALLPDGFLESRVLDNIGTPLHVSASDEETVEEDGEPR